MRLEDMAVFSRLGDALRFHTERARVLAENVANADTPGFVPRDIAGGEPANVVGKSTGPAPMALVRAHPEHFASDGRAVRRYEAASSPDTEVTKDGNAVVLEEQISRVAETRLAYETTVGVYQKSLGLLRLASRSPTQ